MSSKVNLSDFIDLNELLGSGTFGNVILVEEKATKQRYAAKISILDNVNGKQEFDREISILSAMKYPSIIGFRGYSDTDFKGNPYPTLINEYMPNKSLDDVLKVERKGPEALQSQYPAWNNTKKFINLLGIALGMKFLHDHNILHRDLKCMNILLDKDLYPRICDFGISRIIDPDASISMTMNVGSPLFMAPEIIMEECDYSFPVDVYSYGILAYELISGKVPMIPGSKSVVIILNRVSRGMRPDISVVPEKNRSLVTSCWNQNWNERPTFDEIVENLIENRDIWLDDVDEDEVDSYLYQFGRSIKPEKILTESSSKIAPSANPILVQKLDYIKNLKKLPACADFSKYSEEKLLESCSEDMKNYYMAGKEDRDTAICYYVGYNIYMGTGGFPEDMFYALDFFKTAAERGHRDAMYSVGLIYSRDDQNPQSKEIAFNIIDMAADQGSVEAYFALGIFYRTGFGVEKNIVMSAISFKIAADKGNVECMLIYAKLLNSISSHSYNEAKLKNAMDRCEIMLKDEAKKNNYFYTEAKYTLETISNDKVTEYVSQRYFEKAANKGDEEAIEAFSKMKKNEKVEDFPPDYFEKLYKTLNGTLARM